MKLARREFLHLAAGATRPAGPAGPPGGGGGGGRPFGQNVLDYGANPTGQSDSVGAFEAAMKAGGATTTRPRSYGLVQIPLGRYAFSRPCNLAVVGSQLGVRFQGECVATPLFGNGASSSTIIAPPGDFAFKNGDFGLAGGLLNSFEHMCFQTGRGGGIYMAGGGLTVRNCMFAGGGTHIYLHSSWKSYIGQCVFRGSGRTDTNNFGCKIFGQECTLDTVDFEAMGTAVLLQGGSHEVRQMRCESSRHAFILGQGEDGNPSFLVSFKISVGEMESNSQEIWIVSAERGEISYFPILGHEIYDGDVFTQYAVRADHAVQVKLTGIGFGGRYTQAPIVSNVVGNCKLELCSGRNAMCAPANTTYPAGTTQIKLIRSPFDTQLPGWLVPGLTVTDPFVSNTFAPGTTVQQVIQPDTIVLSKPTTGRIIGSGYPPQGDTSVQGNFISFTGPDGIARGVFDGPATNGWMQELCDLGR